MNIKEVLKKNRLLLVFLVLISIVVFLLLFKRIGIKDSAMVSLATAMLIFDIYYASIDMKKSILLFILFFPIFVTARKVVYFDILFIKVSCESIYITIMFFINIKSIAKIIKVKLYKKNSLSSKFLLLVLVFVVLAINSNIFSEHIMSSLSSTFISIIIPVMFMLTTLVVFEVSDIKNIYYALILSLDFSCIYGFVQVLKNHMTLGDIQRNRSLLTFGYHNVNIFAGILLLVVPLVLELILYARLNKKEKIFLYTSLIINMVALAITFTRGAWICFLIATFIILISKKYRKIVYVLGIAFLVSSKWIIAFILHRGLNVQVFNNESMIARLQAIVASIKIMIQYPFGTGGATFGEMYKKFAMDAYLTFPTPFRLKAPVANYTMEMAHNLWLQIAVEFGVVCSILFFLIILNRLKVIFQEYNENRGIFTSVIIYLIFSVLTGVEFDHKGVITGTLIIWLIFTIIELRNKEGYLNEKIN